MNDGIKITIEEWAGDNNIDLSSEQVEELASAIDTTYDMIMPCGYGIDQMESKEKGEIKQLRAQIDWKENLYKIYTFV